MSLSEFLSQVEAVDGEVRVYQHDQTGAFYALGDGLGEETIRYYAGEDSITTLEGQSVYEADLVRVPELELSTNK
jgi:hypothetical protein